MLDHHISPAEIFSLENWFKALPVPLYVLVVDDYPDDRQLLKFFLESKGIRVLEGPGGNDAVQLAAVHCPDMILMDIHMPGGNGIEATRQLKAMTSTRHIPILAFSNDCDDSLQHQNAIEAGCVQCISKASTLYEVLEAIQKAVTKARPLETSQLEALQS